MLKDVYDALSAVNGIDIDTESVSLLLTNLHSSKDIRIRLLGELCKKSISSYMVASPLLVPFFTCDAIAELSTLFSDIKTFNERIAIANRDILQMASPSVKEQQNLVKLLFGSGSPITTMAVVKVPRTATDVQFLPIVAVYHHVITFFEERNQNLRALRISFSEEEIQRLNR